MGEVALVFAASVGVPCVLFYLLLRHWIFVVLALVPPVAVLAVLILLRGHGIDQALIASMFGTICVLSLGDRLALGVSAGLHGGTLMTGTAWQTAFAAGPILLGYLLFLGCEAAIVRDWHDPASIALLFLTAFLSALVGHLLVALFPFSEHAIARANAAREWRERMFEHFLPAMQPRWAFSVTGIALVLCAVALFGIRDAHPHWMMRAPLSLAAGLIFAFVATAVIVRQWRMTAALVLATLFNCAFVLWPLVRWNPYPDVFTVGALLVFVTSPLAAIALQARMNMDEGDDIASALAAAIREQGGLAVAVCIMLGSTGLLWATSSMLNSPPPAFSPALVFAISSTFAALLLYPALAVAIYTLLPRYRTVDEVFGRR